MPYAPGTQDRSGELLGRGLEDFGRGLGFGLQRIGEASQARKKYATIAEAMGRDKDEIASMSLPELEGAVESESIDWLKSRRQRTLDTEAREDKQRGAFETAMGGMALPAGLRPASALDAAMQAGVTDPSYLASAADLQKVMQPPPADWRGRSVPIEGRPDLTGVMTSANSLQVMPPTQAAPAGKPSMQPVDGTNGRYIVIDDGFGNRSVKDTVTVDLTKAATAWMLAGRPGNFGDFIKQIQSSTQTAAPGAAAAKPPAPPPPRKFDLKQFFEGL
jgi:hypothetical protein